MTQNFVKARGQLRNAVGVCLDKGAAALAYPCHPPGLLSISQVSMGCFLSPVNQQQPASPRAGGLRTGILVDLTRGDPLCLGYLLERPRVGLAALPQRLWLHKPGLDLHGSQLGGRALRRSAFVCSSRASPPVHITRSWVAAAFRSGGAMVAA